MPSMAEVDQAAARVAELKAAYADDPNLKDDYQQAKAELARLRTQYRTANGPDPEATVAPRTIGTGGSVTGEES